MKKIQVLAVIFLFLGTMALGAKGAHIVDAPKCVGCKLCVPVCPTKAITMVKGKAVIDPEKCVDCTLCVAKCPTKAISKKKNEKKIITPQKKEIVTKKVYKVNSSRCTGCKECIPVCPTQAITVRRGKAVVDPEKCINCGICAQACAFGAFEKSEVKK